jgi:hypothetical protein
MRENELRAPLLDIQKKILNVKNIEKISKKEYYDILYYFFIILKIDNKNVIHYYIYRNNTKILQLKNEP